MDGLVAMALKALNSGILHFLSLPFVIYYTTGRGFCQPSSLLRIRGAEGVKVTSKIQPHPQEYSALIS